MSSKLSTILASTPLTSATLAAADAVYVYDASASGTNASAGATLLNLAKALHGRSASANSSGNTTITPGALALFHTEVVTVSGAGSTTRIMIIAGTAHAGSRVTCKMILPATAEITIEFRNATSGGTLLASILTDGSGDDVVAEFEGDGSAWQPLRVSNPAGY